MLWKFGQGRCCCIHWQLLCWCSGCFVLTSGSSLFRWLKDACCCLYVQHASLTVIYFGVSQNWHRVVHWCAEGKRELVAKASWCCCSALGLETSFESFPSEYSGSLCSLKWALTILLKAAAEWEKGGASKGCVECIIIAWPYYICLYFCSFVFVQKCYSLTMPIEITGNKPCLHTKMRAVESWRLEETTVITKSNHPHHNHCHRSSLFLAHEFFPLSLPVTVQTPITRRRICNGCKWMLKVKSGRHLHMCVAFVFSNGMHFQTASTCHFCLFRNKAETACNSFWK